MRKMTSKTHGMIDFATSGMMMLLPRLLGQSKSSRRVLDSMAIIILGQSLCTNYEYGLAKFIPFKMHLMLDAVGGAGLIGCAVFNHQLDTDESAVVAGFGAMVVMAAATTKPFSEIELTQRIPLGEVRGADRLREKLEVVSGMI